MGKILDSGCGSPFYRDWELFKTPTIKEEEIRSVEEEVLKIVHYSMRKWKLKFIGFNISINPVSVNRKGTNEFYFSEISIELRKKDKLIAVLPVSIFREGKLTLNVDELRLWLYNKFLTCLTTAGR